MIPPENISTHAVTLLFLPEWLSRLSDVLLRFSTVPNNLNFLTQACILFLTGNFSQGNFCENSAWIFLKLQTWWYLETRQERCWGLHWPLLGCSGVTSAIFRKMEWLDQKLCTGETRVYTGDVFLDLPVLGGISRGFPIRRRALAVP